jgi:hypothetical protein
MDTDPLTEPEKKICTYPWTSGQIYTILLYRNPPFPHRSLKMNSKAVTDLLTTMSADGHYYACGIIENVPLAWRIKAESFGHALLLLGNGPLGLECMDLECIGHDDMFSFDTSSGACLIHDKDDGFCTVALASDPTTARNLYCRQQYPDAVFVDLDDTW